MRLLGWIIGGMCVYGFPTLVGAYATVESRTGDPVVRSSVVANTTDDRAAFLTLKQIDALKQEISELRGLVETQEHEIQQLKKSQQDFYLDLDKRLTESQPSSPRSKEKRKVEVRATPPISEEAPVKTSSVSEAVTVPSSLEGVEPVKVIEPTPPLSAAATTEKECFDAAYQFVRSKRYGEAITGFEDYVTRFPDGEHAANAHYWLGEIFTNQWEAEKKISFLDKAVQEFLHVTTRFPNHQKVADALLKLGMIEVEKQNFVAAREYFIETRERFPTSTAARMADARLQKLH